MRFDEEKEYKVVIKEAFLAEAKFDDGLCSVAILVEDDEGHSDYWQGDFSANYGRGNFSDKTQAEITMQKLKELGLPDGDLSKLDTLVGKETTATVKASESKGKIYYNISYLGGGSSKPVKMDAKKAMSIIDDLVSGNSSGGDENPFIEE